jgi:1-deoxy-D-xylulose-5-phosphate synthase
VEEGCAGGFGSRVLSLLSDEGFLQRGLRVRSLTIPDECVSLTD